jgi:hypothetical protein
MTAPGAYVGPESAEGAAAPVVRAELAEAAESLRGLVSLVAVDGSPPFSLKTIEIVSC